MAERGSQGPWEAASAAGGRFVRQLCAGRHLPAPAQTKGNRSAAERGKARRGRLGAHTDTLQQGGVNTDIYIEIGANRVSSTSRCIFAKAG